jgi:hypothetical protein
VSPVIEVLRHDANDTLLKDVPRPRIGVNDATPPAINKPLSTAAMIRDGVFNAGSAKNLWASHVQSLRPTLFRAASLGAAP